MSDILPMILARWHMNNSQPLALRMIENLLDGLFRIVETCFTLYLLLPVIWLISRCRIVTQDFRKDYVKPLYRNSIPLPMVMCNVNKYRCHRRGASRPRLSPGS